MDEFKFGKFVPLTLAYEILSQLLFAINYYLLSLGSLMKCWLLYRSEAEMQYSKTLAKLSSKLLKLTKESASSVNTAWQRSAVEMETQSEVHRSVSSPLIT